MHALSLTHKRTCTLHTPLLPLLSKIGKLSVRNLAELSLRSDSPGLCSNAGSFINLRKDVGCPKQHPRADPGLREASSVVALQPSPVPGAAAAGECCLWTWVAFPGQPYLTAPMQCCFVSDPFCKFPEERNMFPSLLVIKFIWHLSAFCITDARVGQPREAGAAFFYLLF